MENMVTQEFWKAKRVFLTGHTGFKGSWLTLWLIQMGANVVGYSLAPETDPNLFDLTRIAREINSITGDIRDLEKLSHCVREAKPDIVIHLAAQPLVRYSFVDPVGTYATNIMGTVHLLEALRKTEAVRAIVNVTSDKCYENQESLKPYSETAPMGGYDPYSSSKGCSELVTSAYRRSFFPNIGLATARAGNVIGGGDWSSDRIVPDCIRSIQKNQPIAVRNPKAIRPWQHVLDPLGGYLRLAEFLWSKPQSFSEGWNFGPRDQAVKTVSSVVEQFVNFWGASARWEYQPDPSAPHEAKLLQLNCSQAYDRLKWQAKLDLTTTIRWTADWYKRHLSGESALKLCLSQIKAYTEI